MNSYYTAFRLEPANNTYDVEEGLEARIKDPLLMLGIQSCMGEFIAMNGGHPVQTLIDYETKILNTLYLNTEKYENHYPLEEAVEHNTYQTWNNKHLEYEFSIGDDNKTRMLGKEYDGNSLDWYALSLIDKDINYINEKPIQLMPAPIRYNAMPATRWWQIEDGNVNLAALTRPQLNLLTSLLAEYSLFYSQDWHCIPVDQKIGSLRKINSIHMIDSFSVATLINPVSDCELFTYETGNTNLFYLINNISHGLEGDPLEEVNFIRDELSNLIWAIEKKVTVDNILHNREDEEGGKEKNYPPESQPIYIQEQVPPKYWIPYSPYLINYSDHDELLLRRSTTYTDIQQYQGEILKESVFICEEEIPNVNIKITSAYQLTRDSTGGAHRWLGRKKRVDFMQPVSTLQFDQLIEPH